MRLFVWLNVATCIGAVACASRAPSGDETNTENRLAAATDDLIDNDVVAYAEQCKAELGITAPLPDLSCTDGQRDRNATSWDKTRLVEVPITIDGQPVNESNFSQAIQQGCDRSQWLEERCWTYDLIQRVNLTPDVEAVLNCRQKYATNSLGIEARKAAYLAAPDAEKLDKFKLVYEFNDLGYILRNTKTGKSCFFTSYGVQYYGGWIPAPDRATLPSRDEIYAMLPEPKPPANYDERQWNRGPKGHPELKDNMYFTPAVTAEYGGCIGCHTQGAFKHSPFIDQASAPSVGRIVPSNDRTKPYLLVGRAFQEVFRKAAVAEIDTGATAPNMCLMCHRLGRSEGGAFERAQWAVGINPPAMSTWASQWPQRAWMMPNHGKASEAEYRQALGPHIDKLFCCMKTPDATGCRARPIGPTAADVRLGPDGNLDPNAWVEGAGATSCESPSPAF